MRHVSLLSALPLPGGRARIGTAGRRARRQHPAPISATGIKGWASQQLENTQRRLAAKAATEAEARADAHMVLNTQPMISDLVIKHEQPMHYIGSRVAFDIALPILALWLLHRAIDAMADRATKRLRSRVAEGIVSMGAEFSRLGTLVGLLVQAARAPVAFMLPFVLITYTTRTSLHLVDFVVNRVQPELPMLADAALKSLYSQLVPIDTWLAKILVLTSVVFVAWFCVRLKDIVISEVVVETALRAGNRELERVLLPVSSLLTWMGVAACVLCSVDVLGINLQPILAVGGFGGVAVGFASQQLLQNAISGINIFLTRPFVLGEQVVIITPGANIEGLVEQVEIMRTLVRTDEGVVVAVPNKMLAESVVYNRSRSVAPASGSTMSPERRVVPLQRVLSFYIKLSRDQEEHVQEVRDAVLRHLVAIIKNAEQKEHESVLAGSGSFDSMADGQKAEGLSGKWVDRDGHRAKAKKQAAEESHENGEAQELEEEEEEEEVAEPPVSINLSKMTDDMIELFVKCELSALNGGNIERLMESTLMSVSRIVSVGYKGKVITDSAIM